MIPIIHQVYSDGLVDMDIGLTPVSNRTASIPQHILKSPSNLKPTIIIPVTKINSHIIISPSDDRFDYKKCNRHMEIHCFHTLS